METVSRLKNWQTVKYYIINLPIFEIYIYIYISFKICLPKAEYMMFGHPLRR